MVTNRKHERDAVKGYVCEVIDGNQVMSGIVCDVSSIGLKVSRLPAGFSATRKHYPAFVSGKNRHYKLLIRPCWSKKEEDNFMDVGFKILDAPWKWMEFVTIMIPKSES